MEIILLENVDQLGIRGDIVTVKAGYARNFLIPKGWGAMVTPENLRKLERIKKKIRQEEMERMGLTPTAVIPTDETLLRYDLEQKPLLDLPDTSGPVAAVSNLLEHLLKEK